MTTDEFRAMTAQGPTVVMVSRDDMLQLLDDRDALAAALALRDSWWPMVPHLAPPAQDQSRG